MRRRVKNIAPQRIFLLTYVTGYNLMQILSNGFDEMQIYAPPSGGIFSAGARYSGFVPRDMPIRLDLPCGTARKLSLDEGDLITITNVDGGARVLIAGFDDDGAGALSDLGLDELDDYPLADDGGRFDQQPLVGWISGQGLLVGQVRVVSVFDHLTGPGERFSFRARSKCTIWIIMPIDGALGDTALGGSVVIELAKQSGTQPRLPEPLGHVRDEFLVKTGTAIAYRVKKGEYVQIIDVEGRQCSDFMAMRSDRLDSGEERFIDSTVTRTMARGAYPGPGLFNKFFDQDMRPLLVVVQDTVGRHDTFALACTARGYEERGFPGHLNCSDNISSAYAPFGIRQRPAWPAVNFFFNSWIDPGDNQLQVDEAWSRPGDYVVLQAMTDLVCVSTACPDDIDPINGWNPTDIHVRIYHEKSQIHRAIAYRPFAESQVAMTENSKFHSRTSALTDTYHVARDLWLPHSYEATRAIDEYWACRNNVIVQDMSSLRKFDIVGPDAERLLQLCLTRNIAKLSVNRGVYALMLSKSGVVLDDGTLFRLAPDLFRWCCGSEESGRHLKEIAEQEGLRVWVKSLWSAMPNLAIQGPKSRELLSKLCFFQPTQPKLDTLKWFGVAVARLYDRDGPAFMLTRTGFTGELGYEIFCDGSNAEEIWDAVMDQGIAFGLKPMGNEALDIIRIEAGLMSAGAEFASDVDAFEAGLGFAVDLNKDEFIGRDALERNRLAPRRKLVGLIFEGSEVPSHGDGVFLNRQQIGQVTSATRSPLLQKTIAMARVAVEYSEVDTVLEVGKLDGRLKRLPAKVCGIPFVDPTRTKARA